MFCIPRSTGQVIGERLLALFLSVFLVFSVSLSSYQKSYATGAEGIIALGTVPPPVALVTLLCIGGVCAVEAYNNREELIANGEYLWGEWSDYIGNASLGITESEAWDWLTSVSQGHLYVNDVFQGFKDFVRHVATAGNLEYSEITGNSFTYQGNTYNFSPSIYRAESPSSYVKLFTHANDSMQDLCWVIGNNSKPVYYSVYNYSSDYYLFVASSEQSFKYGYYMQQYIGNGADTTPSSTYGFDRRYYYYANWINKANYTYTGDLPLSITSEGFNIVNRFQNIAECQGWLQTYGTFENVNAGDIDDVIIKNPSIANGGVYSHNDVIGLAGEWGLINGADVIVNDGVIDYPLDIVIDWTYVDTLIGLLNDVIDAKVSPIDVGVEIGVIPYSPVTDWTIADDPADSVPVQTTKPAKPKPGTDVSDDNKPFTFPYDLTGIFPFCIPFDLIAFYGLLNAEPQTPEFTIGLPNPLNTGELITTKVDLHDYDGLAEVCRNFECLLFILLLIYITRAHMIKG